MKKQKFLKSSFFVIFVFLFTSTSYLTIINSGVAVPTFVNEKVNTEKSKTTISLFAIDDDPIVKLGVGELTEELKPFVDINTETIVSLGDLEHQLTESEDDYIVIMGHSNEDKISINKKEVSWNDFSKVINEVSDKIILLPTCFSKSIYQYDLITKENIIAPFAGVVDYQISLDITTLAIALFLEDNILLDHSIGLIVDDYELFNEPKQSLTITTGGVFYETGRGYFDGGYLYDKTASANIFLGDSAVRFGILALTDYLILGGLPVLAIVHFLLDVFLWAYNWSAFYSFFYNYLHLTSYDYGYEYDTRVQFTMTYDDFGPLARFIYYYSSRTTTTFEVYSYKFDITSTSYKRRIFTIMMEVFLVETAKIEILNFLEFSLMEQKIINWYLLSVCDRIYYVSPPTPPGGGGGGGDDSII